MHVICYPLRFKQIHDLNVMKKKRKRKIIVFSILGFIIISLILCFYPRTRYCHRCHEKLRTFGIFDLLPHSADIPFTINIRTMIARAYVGPVGTPEDICASYDHVPVSKSTLETVPFIEKPEILQSLKKELEELEEDGPVNIEEAIKNDPAFTNIEEENKIKP